jgi:hypothetical protein
MKISRKNWESSKKKWGDRLKEQIAKQETWNDYYGWERLKIRDWCGYCEEFRSAIIDSCDNCSLYPVTCSVDDAFNDSLYNLFLKCYLMIDDDEMICSIKSRPAYKRSERLRQRIYKAILKDEKNVYDNDVKED